MGKLVLLPSRIFSPRSPHSTNLHAQPSMADLLIEPRQCIKPMGTPTWWSHNLRRIPGQLYVQLTKQRLWFFWFGWGSNRIPPPPRVKFPRFDGINPRAWCLKCESYFQVCSMHSETWVNCAVMYFIDAALSCCSSSRLICAPTKRIFCCHLKSILSS
jgi:hypothetical protein